MDKVVHFEIPADNVERAAKFYKKIFNWELTKTPIMDDFYLVNTVKTDEKGIPITPGAINGDIGKRSELNKYTTIVIKVQDIDETINKLKKQKCKVLMEKQKIGDMGIYTKFIDCEGNIMGLWQDLK